MKNQYFGDKNDFFKYDFVLTLMENIIQIKTFTFIPMLTENDESDDGTLVNYTGNRRKDLEIFLKKCVINKEREVSKLSDFMKNKKFEYNHYKDTEYFKHNSRQEYFNGIKKEMLKATVILLDPDNGFEISSMRKSKGNKYLKYSEVEQIYDKMGSDSVVIVYQHIPRVSREDFFKSIGDKLKQKLYNGQVICISNNVIAFFIISKGFINSQLKHIAERYAEQNKYKFYLIEDFNNLL